ncbi:uncharacterized protein JCM6883_000033 [Sporobolomyces salmoneus]|uniref:uncharacterized protein n=1 Tax=Sporobolomyces salmoneus TaxID=183962 RepID=UPI003172A3BC
MPPRKVARFSTTPGPDPSSSTAPVPSTSTSTDQPQPEQDGTASEERTGDDQQISRILAEMAQSNVAPDSGSASRSGRTTRSKRNSTEQTDHVYNSHAHSPNSIAALADVSTAESGVSALVGSLSLPTASTSTSHSAQPHVRDSDSRSMDQDELDNGEGSGSGENEGGGGAIAQSETDTAGGAKGKAKKGERRARGNGDEHKGMTEAEWEASRKANHKEVERRRRETINAGLDRLAALLPPVPTPPSGSGGGSVGSSSRASKPNKSEILEQGIEYIQSLKKAHHEDSNRWGLERVLKDQEIRKLQLEIERLKETNEALVRKVEELEGGSTGVRGREEGAEGDEGERENKRRRLDGEGAL